MCKKNYNGPGCTVHISSMSWYLVMSKTTDVPHVSWIAERIQSLRRDMNPRR